MNQLTLPLGGRVGLSGPERAFWPIKTAANTNYPPRPLPRPTLPLRRRVNVLNPKDVHSAILRAFG